MGMSIPVENMNHTLYIKNLLTKLSKLDTKRVLHALFGPFGKVLDVVCGRNKKLRGQAWVVFSEAPSANAATKALQGFSLFDKQMKIEFANSKSAIIAKINGSYTLLEKKRKRNEKSVTALKLEVQNSFLIANSHNILFVENLPLITTTEMLKMLFQQFSGFVEVIVIPNRSGIAFIEFESEAHAL